ncbi:MAG: RNA methyltransferase [Peptoniphilus sp.]|nr:RNA methyltransferase [Peptoniphilus sp.]MDD7363841.1 RNA methyltransferase [Bacillota bacterium]MDY6044320.1 RNA methyltransferase [Peptoniphilus sp.]
MKRIDSAANARYKAWKKLKDKKYRERYRKLLVEGLVVISEVAREGYVEELLIDAEKIGVVEEALGVLDAPATVLRHDLFVALTSTESSQGAIAVCRHFLRDVRDLPKRGRYLYVDGIRDPGNLGGMIRSAEAFYFDGVLLGPGTVDSANDKCIRASMASAFRVPVAVVKDEELLAFKATCPFYGLDIQGENLSLSDRYGDALVLIVGNEAHGIREELLERIDYKLRIPMKETIDSLNANVATSIAMFALQGGGQ